MLKMTDINLRLITDTDMYQMVEKDLHGGVSYIANRYSKPNNKYLSDYDENKNSSYLMYLDANAHYSWGMSQSLPTGRFKWLKEDKWDAIFKKKEWLKKDEWGVILKKDVWDVILKRKEGIGYFI